MCQQMTSVRERKTIMKNEREKEMGRKLEREKEGNRERETQSCKFFNRPGSSFSSQRIRSIQFLN